MDKKLPLLVLLTALMPTAWADDARAIVEKSLDRDDGKTMYSKQTIATCRYTKQNQGITCADTPRIKVTENARKDYGAKGKDVKTVMIILDPPGEKGIGLLQYDYEQQGKDADQWMYLSALGKVKRIVSGKEDEPKTGSLFGSEFTYEDIEERHIDDATYKLMKEENYQGRPAWIIESLPTPERARKSNYSRSIQWIDKERYTVLKVLLYDRRGRPVKMLLFNDYELKDGIWIAKKMSINNVQTKRISSITTEHVALNITMDDALFTRRTLTDGAFRERHLNTLRQAAGL